MAEYICTACGYEGPGRTRKRGSKGMEIFIWSVLMVPGPFYSLYRRVGLKRECTHCGLPTVVNVKSDAGFVAKRKIDIELGVITVPKVEEKKEIAGSFGNDKPAEKRETKRVIDPEQF